MPSCAEQDSTFKKFERGNCSLTRIRRFKIRLATNGGKPLIDMWTSALFLKAIFTSKFVEGTKPLSTLFIAESGSAKTDLTCSFERIPSTWRVPVGSIGTGILKKVCQMEDLGHEIDFLIIDDL